MNDKKTNSLIEAFLTLKNKTEAKAFLRDLLTEEEIIEFGNRWMAAQMLSQKVSYSIISKKTGLSSTTIARISKWLNKGMDGYKLVLVRFAKHHKKLLG